VVTRDYIGRRDIAYHGHCHAARARIARKHDFQATPFCDAANSSPFPSLSRWGRAGFVAGQPHKVANLKDRDWAPISVEIKFHGCHYAQSLRD
jgi:hypothetical protein